MHILIDNNHNITIFITSKNLDNHSTAWVQNLFINKNSNIFFKSCRMLTFFLYSLVLLAKFSPDFMPDVTGQVQRTSYKIWNQKSTEIFSTTVDIHNYVFSLTPHLYSKCIIRYFMQFRVPRVAAEFYKAYEKFAVLFEG